MAAPKMTPFAARLRAARDAAGLSQGQLAMLAGVATITIRRWESANGEPTVSQLVILAFALNRTVSDLLEGTEPDRGTGLVGRLLALEEDTRGRLDALEDDVRQLKESSD